MTHQKSPKLHHIKKLNLRWRYMDEDMDIGTWKLVLISLHSSGTHVNKANIVDTIEDTVVLGSHGAGLTWKQALYPSTTILPTLAEIRRSYLINED